MSADEVNFDAERAFGGVDRVLGAGATERLARAEVAVVGVGGVGSWAVEALARSGVGALRLIDSDHVAESNINRQLPALISTLGRAKTDVLAERIAQINPHCRVTCVDDFVSVENVATMLPSTLSYALDCIDAPRVKAAMIAQCAAQGTPFVTCGAAGGKCDAGRLRCDDLARSTHDALLASVRAQLRRTYGFARTGAMQVRCVSSDEASVGARGGNAGLACAGYGSLVTVTATMGLIAAGEVVRAISAR